MFYLGNSNHYYLLTFLDFSHIILATQVLPFFFSIDKDMGVSNYFLINKNSCPRILYIKKFMW